MISIEEFRKLELKIATIRHAEPHPNADRLLVLNIDLGSEERQLVGGIRGHYAPEDLIGKPRTTYRFDKLTVVRKIEPPCSWLWTSASSVES